MIDVAANFRQAIRPKNIWLPSDPDQLHSIEILGDKIIAENTVDHRITFERLFDRPVKVRRMNWTPLVAAIFVPEEPDDKELRGVLLFHPERREDGEMMRLERAAVECNGDPVPDRLVISTDGPDFQSEYRSYELVAPRMHDIQRVVGEQANRFTRVFSPAGSAI